MSVPAADPGAGVDEAPNGGQSSAVRTGRAGEGRAGRLRERDRGAASILVAAVGLVLVMAGTAAATVGAARIGRHRAQVAADMGALAGAARAVEGREVACAQAGRFVAANGGRLASCQVDGLECVVRAEVVVRIGSRGSAVASAAARAGPVYAVPD